VHVDFLITEWPLLQLILLENVEGQKKQAEKKYDDTIHRLRDVEKQLEMARKENFQYQVSAVSFTFFLEKEIFSVRLEAKENCHQNGHYGPMCNAREIICTVPSAMFHLAVSLLFSSKVCTSFLL
jgi:hypothetical protein